MLVLIDNYDSFTYNLYQYLCELGADVRVIRNDAATVPEIVALGAERVILSPGPCTPNEAGICVPLIQALAGRLPILGVCLGHQAIGAAFGGTIVRAPSLMHGKTSAIHHTEQGVFAGLPTPFTGIRYHSLVVDRATLPDSLEVTAETADGLIMGMRHRTIPALEGVQFHPESILTEHGHQLLRNFLDIASPHPAQSRVPAAQMVGNGIAGEAEVLAHA
jgi:anthranilate synthase component 2